MLVQKLRFCPVKKLNKINTNQRIEQWRKIQLSHIGLYLLITSITQNMFTESLPSHRDYWRCWGHTAGNKTKCLPSWCLYFNEYKTNKRKNIKIINYSNRLKRENNYVTNSTTILNKICENTRIRIILPYHEAYTFELFHEFVISILLIAIIIAYKKKSENKICPVETQMKSTTPLKSVL